MSYELAQKYVDFQIPSEIKQAAKAGVRMTGSLNFIKMMMFADEVQALNQNYACLWTKEQIDLFITTLPR